MSDDNRPVRYGDAVAGYLPDGVSVHSHSLAAGHTIGAPAFKDHAPDKTARIAASKRARLDGLIAHEVREVARLERRVDDVRLSDPHRAKCRTVKLQRTRFLLARLRREREALQ